MPFDPGPPREPIDPDEMPSAEELPAILKFLELAGLEISGQTLVAVCAICATPLDDHERLDHDHSARTL